MQNLLTMLAVAVLCAVTCVASAEQTEPAVRFDFFALDTNGDMYVDPQEFGDFTERMREAMRGRFGNGRGGPADRLQQLYGGADTDGDGMLNETEFNALKEKIEIMRNHMHQRMRDDSN